MSHSSLLEDELDYDDVLSNDSFDDSFCFSEPDENPKCISLDMSNGSTLNKDNFTVLHYNINSILAEGRLEELGLVCSTLNVAVLICTESKLSQTIPNNLLQINGYYISPCYPGSYIRVSYWRVNLLRP